MATDAGGFYDDLAGNYHLLFEDWEESMLRQASTIGPILERECGMAGKTVFDCACGIGTQALGLAKLGFCVTGADVSVGAVERARSEAASRNLDIPFYAADMRSLDKVPAARFHAVICMDNALPHLLNESDLAQAAGQIRAKLRTGGTFMASIRDYDAILAQPPVVQGPTFYSDEGKRRILFQVWDWQDDRRYMFHLFITKETSNGWENYHGTSIYRAVLREEISGILAARGFTNIRWRLPAESGFYQPIVIATAAGRLNRYISETEAS
jgi:2-polyprenyl-3-methyl-5-hydroxy-6-metoxy-1,4-benzoquinol methylase